MGTMRTSPIKLFIGVVLAGQFMANVDTAIINVATPSIGSTLHASGAELQLTVSVYVLVTAMLLITAARLGAIHGYGRMFLLGLVTFTLASLGCGAAPDIHWLIAARVVQGAGASLMVSQVISTIQRSLGGEARTRAIGWYTTTLSLSAVSGQILGGVLITANLFGLAWRPLFLINVPIGIALFVLALRALPRDAAPAGPRPQLDFAGIMLVGVTMLAFTLPLTLGREMQWPWWTYASLALSVVGFAAFVWWQHRLGAAGREPLLNLALFRVPGMVFGVVSQMCGRVTYFSLLFVLALYVQFGLRESALVSGLSLLFWVTMYGVAGQVYPRVPKGFAPWLAPLGVGLVTIGFAMTAYVSSQHAGTGPLLIFFLGFGGFGFGLMQTALTAVMTAGVPKALAPDLSGVLATTAPLSALLGVATFGSAYLVLAAPGTVESAIRAFTIVTASYAACTTVAIVASYLAVLRSEGVRSLRAAAA